MNQGITALCLLVSGLFVYGGLGWLVDHWLGTRVWTPVGLIVGAGLGVYTVVRKYGRTR